jgi:hypothetical protein
VVSLKMIDLGPECRSGCKVVLTMAVARPAAAAASSRGSSSGNSNSSSSGSSVPVGPRQDLALLSRQRQAGSGAATERPDDSHATASSAQPRNEPIVVRRYKVWPLNIKVTAPSSLADDAAAQRAIGRWAALLGGSGGQGRSSSSSSSSSSGSSLRERGAAGGGSSDDDADAGSGATTSSGSSVQPQANAVPDIPRSLLFDPLAPTTVSVELELPGVADRGLQVAVAVAGRAQDAAGTAVVAPQVSRRGAREQGVRRVAQRT